MCRAIIARFLELEDSLHNVTMRSVGVVWDGVEARVLHDCVSIRT